MTTQSGMVEERVDAHILRFEPPDLVFGYFVGEVSEEAVKAMARMYDLAPGKLYGIMLTSRMGSMTSGARRAIRSLRIADGVAIVGASRQMELVLSLLKKVLMIANLGKNLPVIFVQTEEEARKWVDRLRGMT
jgi:hypothetical protein